MRIFVAGATGVIGRRAVARLVAAGHDVTGIARTPAEGGAAPARGRDAGRGLAVRHRRAARRGCGPRRRRQSRDEDPAAVAQACASRRGTENTRIRVEGSRNLVDAALAAGAHVFVQESIAFLYGEHGDAWIDAIDHPSRDSPFTRTDPRRGSERRSLHRQPAAAAVVLRFGVFHAADSQSHRCDRSTPPAGACCSTSSRPTATCRPSTPTTRRRRSSPRSTHRPASTTSSTTNRSRAATYARALARAVGRRRLHRRRRRCELAAVEDRTRSPSRSGCRTPSSARQPDGSRDVGNQPRRGRAKVAAEMRRRARAQPVRLECCCGCSRSSASALGIYAQFFPRRSTTTSRSVGAGWRTTVRTTSTSSATSAR